jgi:MerR family transcriptional regulator, light-induced transcriptional regulator
MKGKTNLPKNLYPIRSAGRLTHLSIDTLRAWEKRYGVVQPSRRNGVRLYSEKDVERLSLLRQAVDSGHSIGQVAGLPNKELSALISRPPTSENSGSSYESTAEILDSIERFDYAGANRELGRLASLMAPRELIHAVALPLMRMVGNRWHEEQLRIAQEHLVTQLMSSLLGGMLRIYAPQDPPAVIMTATLSDDLHEFGILAAAILAAGSGLGVIHLGANLPAREISYALKRSKADVVLISITNLSDRMLKEEQLRLVCSSTASHAEVWVGLNPPTTDLRLKGIRVLRSFEELEQEIQRRGGRF